MAQSSQRSQLLAIVDDLQGQLKLQKASSVSTESYKAEHTAHQVTKKIVEERDQQILQLKNEINTLNRSLQELGQDGINHKVEKGEMQGQIDYLNSIISDQTLQIEDLQLRRAQLEQEVSKLKSQIELTQSSKDKIILKLKQELRLQAH